MSETIVPKMLIIEAVVPEALATAIDRQYRVIKGREPSLEELLISAGTDAVHDDYGRQMRAVNTMLAEGITRWRAAFLVTASAEKLRCVLGAEADVPIFEQQDGEFKIRLLLNGLVTGSERPRFRFERWKGEVNVTSAMLDGTDDLAERVQHDILRDAMRSLVKDRGAAVWELIGKDFAARTAYRIVT